MKQATIKASPRFPDEFEFTVNDMGSFSITENGTTFTGSSLEEVMGKVKKARTKAKVKLNIPVTVIQSGYGLEDGTITGVHGGSGNLMIRMESGGTMQASYSTRVLQRMSAEDKDVWVKATTTIEDLQGKLHGMERQYGWGERFSTASRYVEAQIAAAHAGAQADAEAKS